MNSNKYKPINIFSYLILGIPIWVFLGVRFFIFHLISFITFIIIVKKNDNKKEIFKLNEISGIIIYLISMIVSLLINPLNASGENLLSPLYLISFWIMGIFIIISIKKSENLTQDNFYKLGKAAFIIGISTIIIFLVAFILTKLENTITKEFNGLLYYLLPENLKIRFFYNLTIIKLIFNDFGGNGFVLRFNGFEVYQVASAAITLILAVYSYMYISVKDFKNRYSKIILSITYYIMILITLYFNRSRTIIAGIILSLLVLLFIKAINKENYKKVITFFIIMSVAMFIIVCFSGIWDRLINIRPNSNRDRMFVYLKAFEMFKEYPIFGVGVRYFIPESAIAVGSHSTYLGILMRSGIVGFIGILLFKVTILKKIFINKKYLSNNRFKRTIWNITTFIFVFMSIFMIFEDIDWPSIVAFLYFLNIAIILSFDKIKCDDEINIDEIKIGLVGSSGGHLTHLIQIKDFWKDKNRFWVTFEKQDAISQLKNEKTYWCYYPTNRNIINLIKNTFLALKILISEKPDLIISSGAGAAIPFFYIGKLFGAKLIYIEVYDRIDSPTLSGRLVYPICDEFIVQWEEQLKFYPNAKLLGGLF